MGKLVYERHYYEFKSGRTYAENITREKALDIVHGTYRDCDQINDMLLIPNRIRCQYSDIEVYNEDENGKCIRLRDGEWAVPNPDYEYDEDTGKRVEG